MIRAIILFYLNIKPTHGYEIQQFIQLSGIDQWTKIQSGSIYYALTKLEKEENIAVLREERTGIRGRKIYQITEKGKATLVAEMRSELAAPLFSIGSSKFIISPIMEVLDREDIEQIVLRHIRELEQLKEYWHIWQEKKVSDDKYSLTKLSFQMTIHSIEEQILWHKELLEHLDYYKKEAKQMSSLIQSFDADSLKMNTQPSKEEAQIEFLSNLKRTLEENPEKAIENIDAMIQQIAKEGKDR